MLGAGVAVLGGQQGTPVYRFASTVLNSTGPSKPGGIAVGDLIVILVGGNGDNCTLATTSGAAWTKIGTVASRGDVFYKILNATDVANGWTYTSGTTRSALTLVFTANGTQTLTLKDTTTSLTSATTATSAGYTLSAASRGLISAVVDGDVTTPTAPTGHTGLASLVDTNYVLSASQLTSYRSGTVTWTGFATGKAQTLWLFEVT